MLTFDEVRHEYRENGALIPSVTQILKGVGLGTDYDAILGGDRSYSIRGTRIHRVTAALATGVLDFDEWRRMDADSEMPLWPWVAGYVSFEEGVKPKWKAIETPSMHPVMRYAGTPDRFGEVLGEQAIVDLKNTKAVAAEAALQIAGYAPLVKADVRLDKIKRYALQLPGDYTYRLIEYNDPSDHSTWNACVSLYQWKQRN